jgi:hypothetical protein
MIVKILAKAIRKNPGIRGITIDGVTYKILQYADDTCLYLVDADSLQTALYDFKIFYKCSGLKVNMYKSDLDR